MYMLQLKIAEPNSVQQPVAHQLYCIWTLDIVHIQILHLYPRPRAHGYTIMWIHSHGHLDTRPQPHRDKAICTWIHGRCLWIHIGYNLYLIRSWFPAWPVVHNQTLRTGFYAKADSVLRSLGENHKIEQLGDFKVIFETSQNSML